MWVAIRVQMHVLETRCGEGTKEGKGLGLRKDFLGWGEGPLGEEGRSGEVGLGGGETNKVGVLGGI
jgi:hypothetical protein